MTLASVEARIKGLEIELDMLKAQRHELLNAKHQIKPGDWVVVQGVKYKVHSVSHLFGNSKPWLKGFRLRKDGTPSVSARNLYSQWEKTDAPEGY